MDTPAATIFGTNHTCVLKPEAVEGPYCEYSGENLVYQAVHSLKPLPVRCRWRAHSLGNIRWPGRRSFAL